MSKLNRPDDLDRAVELCRQQAVDGDAVDAAARRVEATLAREAAGSGSEASRELRGCADIQALLPAYLAASLPEARLLVLQEHTRECIPCRRALQTLKDAGRQAALPRAPRRTAWLRAAAAVLLLGAGLAGAWIAYQASAPGGTLARVEAASGGLYAVASGAPLDPGRALAAGELIRSGRGGSAFLRLADGTRIEMAERTELALSRMRDGLTIDLKRGRVIIEAAKRRDGRLYLKTKDCLVAVTGTVFSVTHGTKGSRVSVLQGRVEVNDASGEHVLGAGEQVTTHPSLEAVPVPQDIGWSKNLPRHLAMLRELHDLGRQIDERVTRPAPRALSRLIELVPADTVVYAAVPNLGQSLGDAYRVFEERIAASPLLAEWLQKSQGSRESIEHVVSRLSELGSYLGDEILFTVSADAKGVPAAHLLLAEVTRGGLEDFLSRQAAELAANPHAPAIVLVQDPGSLPDGTRDHELLVWIHDALVVATESRERLASFASELGQPGGRSFPGTPFYRRIQEAYRDGVSWLIAFDVETWRDRALAGHATRPGHGRDERQALERSGLADVQHLLFGSRDQDGRSHKQALLTFAGPRRGLASWLAAPSSMGSLAYLSPDALLAAAFVVKDPLAMLDDAYAALQSTEPELPARLEELEHRVALSIREDIARPLGGEIAFALDGPVLPSPSWKLVLEVDDPGTFLHTVSQLVDGANRELAAAGREPVAFSSRERAGRTYHSLKLPGCAREVTFTFDQGYLLAGPSGVVLDRAIAARATGVSLAHSPRLQALFPQDGYANFSALLYQDVLGAIGPMAEGLASSLRSASPEVARETRALGEMAQGSEPSLFCGYAEEDRIRFSGSGPAGLFGMDLRTVVGLRSLVALGERMEEQMGQQGAEPTVGGRAPRP